MVLTSLVGSAAIPFGLQGQAPMHYSDRASLAVQANGSVVVNVNSPRPIYQSMTALAETYSTIMDYEDPVYNESQIYIDRGNKQLQGGVFTAVLPPIKNRDSKLAAVRSLLSQFDRARNISFKLETHSSDGRIDIVAQNLAMTPPLLDTPILLKEKSRTVNQAVDEILSLVEQRTGVTITRGGFLDSGMDVQVDIGGADAQPARNWLAQALDACALARVWVLAFEPTDGKFYLGIQNALGSSDGGLQPLRQPHLKGKKPSSDEQ